MEAAARAQFTIGGQAAFSGPLDAAFCEIDRVDVVMHCLGTVRPPIPPFVGLAVKKSGARTGVTGSLVVQRAFIGGQGPFVAIDNEARFPPSQAGFVSNYAGPGDSGSVSLAGNPTDPNDFGDRINRLIDAIAGLLAGTLLGGLVREALIARLNNAAICLNQVGAVGGGLRLSLGRPIRDIFDILDVELA